MPADPRAAAKEPRYTDRELLLSAIARLRTLRQSVRGVERNPIDRELNAVRRAFDRLVADRG